MRLSNLTQIKDELFKETNMLTAPSLDQAPSPKPFAATFEDPSKESTILHKTFPSLPPTADSMKNIKTGLIFFLLFIGLASANASYTYNLASPSQDAFEDAYYRGTVNGVFIKFIENGDTIVLPAGNATWGNSSRNNNGRLWINHTITVRGAGDSTVITLDDSGAVYANGVVNLLQPNIVWSNMKIKGAGDRPVTAFVISGSGCRLHHITYEGQPDSVPNNGQDGTGYFVFQQGATGTLIDHCTISAALGNHEWLFTRGPTDAWQLNSTVGTSQQDIFVEDCIFNNTGYSDANANGRHVFRFNTINGNIKLDAHGMASNTPARSFRSVEYYNNKWTSSGMSYAAAIEIRGGTAMVFNNTSTTGLIYFTDYITTSVWPNSAAAVWWDGTITATPAGTNTIITTPKPHGFTTGMSVYHGAFGSGGIEVPQKYYIVNVIDPTHYSIVNSASKIETLSMIGYLRTPFNWPIADQVGSGKDGAAREPAYVWGNTQGGVAWARTLKSIPTEGITTYRAQTGNPTANYTERDIIAPNRDVFASSGFDITTGVSIGTRAQMNAHTPSVSGYGWWVTDEGSWNTKLPPNTSGRLYKWEANAWNLYYTPYTYPHPLQTATECALPEPSIQGGTYEYAQTVTLQTSPSTATIRYTTNGATPSETVGAVYNGPIPISSTTNLKAIAYKTGLANSPALDTTYTITGAVFQPTSSVPTGDYHGTQAVSLYCATSGATIRYTLDGSTPNENSPLYSGPISVTTTTTIKAIGTKTGLTNSSQMTSLITILLEVGNWHVASLSQEKLYAGARVGLAYFTAPVTGSLTKISAYGTNISATQDFEFGLYHDIDGDNSTGGLEKVTGTPAQFIDVGTWTNAWRDFSVSFPVTAGEKYWVFVSVSESSSTGITASTNVRGAGYPFDRWIGPTANVGDFWPETFGWTSNRDIWVYNVKGTLTEAVGPRSPAPNTVPSVQIKVTVEPPR